VAKAHFAVRFARPGFAALNNVRAAVLILRRRCCWRHTRMLCAKRPAKRCDRAMGGQASSQPVLPKTCTRRPKAVFFSLRVRLPTVRNEGQRSPDPSVRKQERKRADVRLEKNQRHRRLNQIARFAVNGVVKRKPLLASAQNRSIETPNGIQSAAATRGKNPIRNLRIRSLLFLIKGGLSKFLNFLCQ